MTSAATIIKGKDLETSSPPQANHSCVHLALCVANLQYVCLQYSTRVYSCRWCLRLCTRARLYARVHVGGDKLVLDVS